MMRSAVLRVCALTSGLALLATPVGCRWETDLPGEARSIHVDPSRELLISNDALIGGASSSNRANGPLSFRHAVESLRLRPGALHRWLAEWSERLAAESGDAERAHAFDTEVTCRWLKLHAENQCDEACSSCAEHELDLASAPFRLLAIVNRTDLSVMPDRAGDGGEGRLVFALTSGPADDPRSATLPFSVIVEYAQAGSARSWAERWHELGSVPDAAFPARLTELTDTFVTAGALAQIRSADALTGPMLFHQFRIEDRELRMTNVRNTPDWSRVSFESLRAFGEEQATALDDGTAVMPKEWWAGSSSLSAPPPTYLAELPRRDAIVEGTCAGCHARSATGFHVDPAARGDGRLSSFLAAPTSSNDELRRRALWMQLTLSR